VRLVYIRKCGFLYVAICSYVFVFIDTHINVYLYATYMYTNTYLDKYILFIGDFKAINKELQLFSPLLASKPQVVVLNKIDIPEVAAKKDELMAGLLALMPHTRLLWYGFIKFSVFSEHFFINYICVTRKF
jgi:hypothetical protein